MAAGPYGSNVILISGMYVIAKKYFTIMDTVMVELKSCQEQLKQCHINCMEERRICDKRINAIFQEVRKLKEA